MSADANIYKYKPEFPVKLGQVTFQPDSTIKVILNYTGGGFGFGGLLTIDIVIGDDSITEKKLHYEPTPIYDFITENDGLFEKIA